MEESILWHQSSSRTYHVDIESVIDFTISDTWKHYLDSHIRLRMYI